MRPVASRSEIAAVEAAALGHVSHGELIERAGAALARSVLAHLGGGYGRRVVVVEGKGHNGDDARVAARHLRRRGVRVRQVAADWAEGRSAEEIAGAPDRRCDLVIDGAYGTGFRGEYHAPGVPPGALVVAVDIPSGLSADDGSAHGVGVRADVTVTFSALKPGLVLGQGPDLAGRVEVVDIGLDTSRSSAWLVEDLDVVAGLVPRPRSGHKWQSAVGIVAGSPGMMGAAQLCAAGAARAGAGMVRLGVPGAAPTDLGRSEAVASVLEESGWAGEAADWLDRCRAVVVGPGLGRGPEVAPNVAALVKSSQVPVVVDADGLNALAMTGVREVVMAARAPVVLTPHAAEFARLAGHDVGRDVMGSVRGLARSTGAVVLLKGSTTVVAEPGGRALLVTTGSARLATAGTGDVLAGMIGAFLAEGVGPAEAAAWAAHVHGRAATRGRAVGLVAGDLPALVADWLSENASTAN